MRRRLGRLGLYFAGALVVAYLIISLVLFRQPPDEALQAAVEKTAQDVVLLESSGARQLEIDSAVPVLRETLDSLK